MKTAVSIEDEVFFEAESAAKEMGLSRSKLYSNAVLEFIRNHRPGSITDKYNKIYSENEIQMEDDIAKANYELFSTEEW